MLRLQIMVALCVTLSMVRFILIFAIFVTKWLICEFQTSSHFTENTQDISCTNSDRQRFTANSGGFALFLI